MILKCIYIFIKKETVDSHPMTIFHDILRLFWLGWWEYWQRFLSKVNLGTKALGGVDDERDIDRLHEILRRNVVISVELILHPNSLDPSDLNATLIT